MSKLWLRLAFRPSPCLLRVRRSLSTTPASRGLSSVSVPANNDWRVWAALDSRDEAEKVRLAQLLHDLEALAAEKQQPAVAALSAPALDVPESNADYVRLPSKLTRGTALDTFEQLAQGGTLHPDCLLRLLQDATDVLAAEPTLLDLKSLDELSVVGDLHGSMECLQLALKACDAADGLAPGKGVLFNGDFVDRGTRSTEVLSSLLLLKLSHPARLRPRTPALSTPNEHAQAGRTRARAVR